MTVGGGGGGCGGGGGGGTECEERQERLLSGSQGKYWIIINVM